MRLIDADEAARLYGEMGPAVEVSGGTVPNSCVGVSSRTPGSRTGRTGAISGYSARGVLWSSATFA